MIQFGAEEVVQSLSGLFGCLFREEVSGTQGSGTQGVPPNVVALPSPERDRSTLLDLPGGERSSGAPQDQERTGSPALTRTICLIVLAIYARGGPVLLTDGLDVAGTAKSLYVGGADLRRKHGRRRACTCRLRRP